MTNPYDAPQAQQANDEIQLTKRSFFAPAGVKALDCSMGKWSPSVGYLETSYVSAKVQRNVVIIFCVVMIGIVPFALVGGMGGIILYVLLMLVAKLGFATKVRFNLKDEDLLVDKKRKVLGVKTLHKESDAFVSVKMKAKDLEALLSDYEHTEVALKKGSNFLYGFIMVVVWIACLVTAFYLHTDLFEDLTKTF